MNVTGNVDFDSDLLVNGNTQLDGTLDVFGATYIDDVLNVTGNVDFDSNLLVNGSVDIDTDLNVDGNTTLNGNVALGDAQADMITFPGLVNSDVLPVAAGNWDLGGVGFEWQDIYFDGMITGGDATFDNLTVLDNTTLGTALTDFIYLNGTVSSNIGNLTIVDNVDVTGNSYFNGTMNVTGAVDFDNTLNVDLAATFNNAITQTNAAAAVTFAGPTTVNNTLHVTNNADFDLDVNVDGVITNATTGIVKVDDDLNVTGNTDLDGTLLVNGTSNFNANADFDVDVNVDGVITNATTGIVKVDDDLNVTGNTDLDGNLLVNGNGDVDGNFNVDGATTLNGNVALGDAQADMITFPGLVNSDVLPVAAGNWDLGGVGFEWQDIYYDGTLNGGDAAFDNLWVWDNTQLGTATTDNIDLRGTIFNTAADGLDPLWFADDLIPNVTNTYDLGSSTNTWQSLHIEAIDVWGNTPGGITVHNTAGISIIGSGGLNIASGGAVINGGAVITGGATVNGLLTANNGLDVHQTITNSTTNIVEVNDNLQVNGDFMQTAAGGMYLGYQVINTHANLSTATAAVISYSDGGVAIIDAALNQMPATTTNGKIVTIHNATVAGLTVQNLQGLPSMLIIPVGGTASFVYIGGWRLLQ